MKNINVIYVLDSEQAAHVTWSDFPRTYWNQVTYCEPSNSSTLKKKQLEAFIVPLLPLGRTPLSHPKVECLIATIGEQESFTFRTQLLFQFHLQCLDEKTLLLNSIFEITHSSLKIQERKCFQFNPIQPRLSFSQFEKKNVSKM